MCIPFNLCGLRGILDSSRAPGLTSGLQGSVNVYRGALLLVPQWQCISSFVFYIIKKKIIGAQDTCVYVTGVIWGVIRYVWDILRE